MRNLIRDLVLAIAFSSILVFVLASASRAQPMGGPLDECKPPQKVIEEVAEAVGVDRFIGARIFNASDVKKIADDVVAKTGQPFEYDTLAVVYVKADPREGGTEDTAIALMGKNGQVCEFAILPASMMRDYLTKIFGPSV